jgi:hypothetical protein
MVMVMVRVHAMVVRVSAVVLQPARDAHPTVGVDQLHLIPRQQQHPV